jgi:hypothetical protein
MPKILLSGSNIVLQRQPSEILEACLLISNTNPRTGKASIVGFTQTASLRQRTTLLIIVWLAVRQQRIKVTTSQSFK